MILAKKNPNDLDYIKWWFSLDGIILEGKSICPAQKKELTRKLKKLKEDPLCIVRVLKKREKEIMKKEKNTKG